MSFTRDLTEILTRFAAETLDFIEKTDRKPFRDILITASSQPQRREAAFFHCGFLPVNSRDSSHRRMADFTYTEARKADILALRDLLDHHAPALDLQNKAFTLELRTPSKTGKPRMRLEVAGHQVATSPLQVPTIVKRLARTAHHLRGVPFSTARIFDIYGLRIRARDGYDAMRIYAALAFPGTLDDPPLHLPHIEIHEILDHRPLVQALFTPAEDEAAA